MRILITAGPTREKIDPVRFISNYATGTFGYEIAREAVRRGHSVTLVSGPTGLTAPRGAKLVRVETALEMYRAALKEFAVADCVVMTAAVSDWRPRAAARGKIKKRGGRVSLELVENPDIVREMARRRKRGQVVVGFALETSGLEQNALKKMREKGLDIVIANKMSRAMNVFGDRPLDVLIIDRDGRKRSLFGTPKRELAKIVLDKISGSAI